MDEIQNSPIPESRFVRCIYFIILVVLPVASFSLAFDGSLGPEWQSGEISDYVSITLQGEVAGLFYPFCIYAILSFLLLFISYRRFSKYPIVRFGIYSGVILALQYSITMLISFHPNILVIFVVGVCSTYVIGMIYHSLVARFGSKILRRILIGLFVGLILTALFPSTAADEIRNWLLYPIFYILATGPFWCMWLAVRMAIPLARGYEFSRPINPGTASGAFAWLFAYIAAWRFAVLKTLEIYSTLPTSPPNCYIATAAAKGHPIIVKTEPIEMRGWIAWINPQLRYFKCAELALMTLFPVAHKICRWMYDRVGSRLAAFVRSAIVADVVYVSLKPVEWIIKFVLKLLISDLEVVSYRVYASEY